MEAPRLSSLQAFTEIGLRGGVDMRPTLLRVLTDLYVQKLSHTPDEDRHYTELALRLLESVDVPTRLAVAMRLAHHLSPPAPVIQKLAADLPEIAAALRALHPSQARSAVANTKPKTTVIAVSDRATDRSKPAKPHGKMDVDLAGELNELFFGAGAPERRLILLNLHVVASASAAPSAVVHDPAVGRRLEASVLARKREDFARELSRALSIGREQARRIAGDELGEPIVVAAKALGVSRDQLHRILLFVNTAIGHSVERVHTLATLYDEMHVQAAFDLVEIWQALAIGAGESAGAVHQPLPSHDRLRAQLAPATRRTPPPSRDVERRDAS
jgi:hypothetical protein